VSDQEFLGILEQVASILNTLEIPHAVVGSVASSRFGLHRATMDVDIVTDLKPAQILGLVNALRPDFYIDEVLISQAIIQHSSFNALHLETGTKLDFFVLKPREYDRVALNRRSEESPSFMTAEDVLLGKLEWYRLGDETSERQWNDILGILRTQANLDFEYLHKWAATIGVLDLLERAQKT
jgi:lipoate synthase